MSKLEKKTSIVKYKLLYTFLILLLYLAGREIPLYGIDTAAYIDKTISAEDLLMQIIGGDTYRYSLFAIGVSPYMLSSIFIQVYAAYKKAGTNERVSMQKMNKMILAGTLFIAVIQAAFHVRELEYKAVGKELLLAQGITVLQMVTGVMIILWLSERNRKYGIGGQTALIYMNIIDGIVATLQGHTLKEMGLPLVISAAVVLVIVFMENAEFRIPLQRISIHNIYADKNYLAIKLNPIGTMPVMFSTAFFMLPQLIGTGLAMLFPGSERIAWWNENMVLTKPLGIGVYIGIIYVLTIVFSFILVNPKELTEQFLKSGDCLLNIHAGRDTRRYLAGKLCIISFFSATIMSMCLGVPLLLQYRGSMESTLVMLPSSMMLLTGMWCTLGREYQAIKSFDSYRMFI